MNYLRYSKKFRKNLIKWLTMYCCVLCLFTIVTTYSRYITNKTTSDSSRIAKFDVNVTYDGICTSETNICSYGELRPTEYLDYYFTVDTTNLEVGATFVTNIMIADSFDNYKLYDITTSEVLYEKDVDYQVSNNTLSITEDIPADDGYIRKYKLNVHYKNNNIYDQEVHLTDAVIIGYSAIQK